MSEEQPPPKKRETIPERVRRVAGHSLKAEPYTRLWMIALPLIFILAIIVTVGVIVGTDVWRIVSPYTNEIEREAPENP